jgi:hypothetical protein
VIPRRNSWQRRNIAARQRVFVFIDRVDQPPGNPDTELCASDW